MENEKIKEKENENLIALFNLSPFLPDTETAVRFYLTAIAFAKAAFLKYGSTFTRDGVKYSRALSTGEMSKFVLEEKRSLDLSNGRVLTRLKGSYIAGSNLLNIEMEELFPAPNESDRVKTRILLNGFPIEDNSLVYPCVCKVSSDFLRSTQNETDEILDGYGILDDDNVVLDTKLTTLM